MVELKSCNKKVWFVKPKIFMVWLFADKDADPQGCLRGSVGSASAFGSGHDPRVLGSSPTSGSLLRGEPASPSACRSPWLCALSLCQINEQKSPKKRF